MKTINEFKQNFLVSRVLAISCLSAVVGLAGCQPDGSSEKAGQRMDHAVENAGQKLKQATKKADQKIEAAKESLDEKADTAKEYIEEKTDASKEVLENAEAKIGKATEKTEEKLEGVKESVIEKSETAGEYIDDSVITTKVKAAIMGSSWLSASHIDVTTNKGIVVLSGTVDTEQNIAKAIEVARSQENVKAVQADLVVSATASGKK
jgi:hyperosmotically inducible periplasmic protein